MNPEKALFIFIIAIIIINVICFIITMIVDSIVEKQIEARANYDGGRIRNIKYFDKYGNVIKVIDELPEQDYNDYYEVVDETPKVKKKTISTNNKSYKAKESSKKKLEENTPMSQEELRMKRQKELWLKQKSILKL